MSSRKKPLRVTYALSVYDRDEENRVLSVLRHKRIMLGKEEKEFAEKIAKLFGKKYGVMINSGSSGNLLAFEILKLPPGSEVITPLLTFSTTIAPIIHKGLVPVFTDVEEGTYVMNVDQVEKLISKKTRAIMVPLLMGNVPDMKKLRAIANKYNLFIIEDSCDTLGAKFLEKPTGTYSDISTTSFYGSHIITAGGGGGMILVNKSEWRDKILLLRGWGRSSSLFSESESIEKRFSTKIDGTAYDAKFIFSEIGYNFLPLEIEAAFGNGQIKKLPSFMKIREKNFNHLYSFFKKYEEFFILPRLIPGSITHWLAFPLTVRKSAPFSRNDITIFLEKHNIQTRPIFTGNVLKQPGFKSIQHRLQKEGYPVTENVMKQSFVIGCHQGMKNQHLEWIEEVSTNFISKYT